MLGVDPKKIKTEVFLLPSAHRLEKAGSFTNSGRWLLWHYQAVKPAFESKPFGYMSCGFMSHVEKAIPCHSGKTLQGNEGLTLLILSERVGAS